MRLKGRRKKLGRFFDCFVTVPAVEARRHVEDEGAGAGGEERRVVGETGPPVLPAVLAIEADLAVEEGLGGSGTATQACEKLRVPRETWASDEHTASNSGAEGIEDDDFLDMERRFFRVVPIGLVVRAGMLASDNVDDDGRWFSCWKKTRTTCREGRG